MKKKRKFEVLLQINFQFGITFYQFIYQFIIKEFYKISIKLRYSYCLNSFILKNKKQNKRSLLLQLIMFSSYNQTLNNILYSQRFYYNNYQYYNDYQKIDSKYKDDLSKVIFKLNRKSKGTIFYEWQSDVSKGKLNQQNNNDRGNMMDVQSNSDNDKKSNKAGNQNKNIEQKKKQLGIQNLLKYVLFTFNQLNYSDIKTDEEFKKQLYQFVNLKYYKNLSPHISLRKYNNNMDEENGRQIYEDNSIQVLNNILKKQSEQKNLYYQAIEKMNSFSKDEDQIFLERWNAFENYGFYYLDHKLIKKEGKKSYKNQIKKLYQFVVKVRYIVQRTLAAQYFNSLFVNIPNLKKTARIFHPLTLGLSYANNFFEDKNGFKQKPKIVFINLDGRQTPYNLRYARNIGSNLLYISVYKEPTYYYKKNQKMEYQFQSDYDTTFTNISECYSRMLINEAFPQKQLFEGHQQQKFNQNNVSKMLLFPLNSDYLRKDFYKNLGANSKNSFGHHKTFPTLQTSNDIYFLFQTIIFQEIRSWNPAFIIVSYNGFLNINEDHWNQIIKNLTIIGDHKVCLYMDWIDRLSNKKGMSQQEEQSQQQEQQQQQQQQQQSGDHQQSEQPEQEQANEEQDDLDEFKVRNIQVIQEFMNKYIPLKSFWPYIEHQKTLNNFLMFLKISSGVYSMQQRLLLAPHLKYSLGDRYNYLECLGKSRQLKSILGNYSQRILKSEELKQLYSSQGKTQLKENRKENQSYQKLIDSVIFQFLDQTNRKQRFSNHYKLLYRLEQVLQQQQYENLLKYGTQQSDNPQYSNSMISNSVTLQNRQLNIMHQYLKEMKKKLLLQNLQAYRHKKIYFYDEEFDSHQQIPSFNAQKIKCYKFYLYEDDSEEISFQKYTQVIFDSKKSKVYIINYKATDQRHLILHGSISQINTFQRKFSVKVQIAKQSQREVQTPIYSLFAGQQTFYRQSNFQMSNDDSMLSLSSQQQLYLLKKDLVFVNYSHCFVKNKLYLYWPQKWSIKDEIRHKLLGMKYKSQNINIIVRVQVNSQSQCIYQTLQLKQNQKIYVNPRIGCTSYQIQSQEDQFFIFGGIQDNENDFFDIGQGMYHMQIKDNSAYFVVKPLPKIKEKNIKHSSISVMSMMRKNLSFANRLRPKMNYRIEKYIESNSSNPSQQTKLVISGGYGREFTNFHNCFSYQSYLFNTLTKLIQCKQIHSRRLIKFSKPIQVNRVGKFYLVTNNQNIQEVQQNFSDLPKDLFAYEYKVDPSRQSFMLGNSNMNRQARQSMNVEGSSFSNNIMGSSNLMIKYSQNKQVFSFMDEKFRTSEFKLDGKKIYLFGFNRTIRERIYSKFWSPQLYIVDGNQSNIVHLSLKTQKNFNYNISNFLMPRQQDMVSVCLDQDRLFVLSSSPVIHSIQSSTTKYVLYEGNLSNMNDVINKHQLQMYERFEFKKQKQFMLKYKTLYSFEEKIYFFGGLACTQEPSVSTMTYQQSAMDVETKNNGKVSYRQDYVLQKQKNKFVLKTRKVESIQSVEMLSPFIIKFNQLLYFYSIQMTQNIINKQGPFPQVHQNYKLKIETFSSQSSTEGKIICQLMKFYAYNPMKKDILRIIPRLNQPKIVSIIKHQPFNLSKLKQHLEKVTIRLNKRKQQSQIQDQQLSELLKKCFLLLRQKNQEPLIKTLIIQDKFFKQLIDYIKPQLIQKDKTSEDQEIIKDLKICYSLVNKLILQKLIQKATIQDQKKQNQTISQSESLMNQNNTTSNYQNSANVNNSLNENLRKQKLVQKLERLTLNAQDNMTQYRFIVQDSKNSRKIRYIAIGPLCNVDQLRFFRIRFKNDLNLCLNKTNQDGFYYHPTINSCQQIDLNDRFAQYDLMDDEYIKNENSTFKEYKLYCQLKI